MNSIISTHVHVPGESLRFKPLPADSSIVREWHRDPLSVEVCPLDIAAQFDSSNFYDWSDHTWKAIKVDKSKFGSTDTSTARKENQTYYTNGVLSVDSAEADKTDPKF